MDVEPSSHQDDFRPVAPGDGKQEMAQEIAVIRVRTAEFKGNVDGVALPLSRANLVNTSRPRKKGMAVKGKIQNPRIIVKML